MGHLVPKSTKSMILQFLTNKSSPENLILKLYSNEKDPKEGDVESDYEEIEGGGYIALKLNPDQWIIKYKDEVVEASYPDVDFTFNGPVGNVYGYYVIQENSGNIVWSDRFDSGPHDIKNNGDQIKVTLKYRLN